MAKDFNIYQWRRNHLNENQVSENTPSWKEEFKDLELSIETELTHVISLVKRNDENEVIIGIRLEDF